jgi:hypothetical protein
LGWGGAYSVLSVLMGEQSDLAKSVADFYLGRVSLGGYSRTTIRR